MLLVALLSWCVFLGLGAPPHAHAAYETVATSDIIPPGPLELEREQRSAFPSVALLGLNSQRSRRRAGSRRAGPRVLVTLATGEVLVQMPSGRLAVILPGPSSKDGAMRGDLRWLTKMMQRNFPAPEAHQDHAASPMPRGRPPSLTKDELRAHITAHPGLSDGSRARMLSTRERTISRQLVGRVRRELEATD